MSKFFKSHPDVVLISLAVLLLAVLFVTFIWGIQTMVGDLNKAISFKLPEKNGKVGFDLEGARALDLRGLVQ